MQQDCLTACIAEIMQELVPACFVLFLLTLVWWVIPKEAFHVKRK